jgi:FKBP-type peptidyl-prolyl cis-trans isomerase
VVGKTAATDSISSSGTQNQKNNNTNNDNNISIQNDQNLETPVEKLSKKERRKLAKQKEKELQQALLQDRGVITTTTSNGNETTKTNKTNSTQKISLTKQRSLPGGLLIRDIIHGTGASVQTGRKVSINYTGSFPDTGKIFDKNTSSKNPLVFRVGTGMVIKGLERGLEGMKVGGERIITIPPELGYGKKGTGGAGGIPPNAILTFEVKLVSVGGKG